MIFMNICLIGIFIQLSFITAYMYLYPKDYDEKKNKMQE